MGDPPPVKLVADWLPIPLDDPVDVPAVAPPEVVPPEVEVPGDELLVLLRLKTFELELEDPMRVPPTPGVPEAPLTVEPG